MFCPSCGTKLPDNSRFCLSCGAQIDHTQSPPKQSFQKVVTATKLDMFSAFIIIISVVMLLASLLLPLFELHGRDYSDYQYQPFSYTLSLFGNNDMDGFKCQDEIVSAMKASLVFSIATTIAVNVFSVLKKHTVQAIFALINTIIIFACRCEISSVWFNVENYSTWTDPQLGFNILFIGSLIVLALSAIIVYTPSKAKVDSPSNEEEATMQSSHPAWLCACGTSNETDVMFCSKCGKRRIESYASSTWVCSNCGAENREDHLFCTHCKKACRGKEIDWS